jgi:hypothetical protein
MSGAIVPYAADVSTLHLWHLDETSAPCADSVAGGTDLNYLINGATPGGAGFFTNAISFGTLATPGAVALPNGSGNVGAANSFTFAGSDGAFTLEALVQIGFNPTNFVRSQPCQILNCDADGTGTRVFQWRLEPMGYSGSGGDTNSVRIVFFNLNNTATPVAVVPIPTNGPDAIVSNSWYHIALTYNGAANTASNLLFYWTLLNTNRTAANCIYGASMAAALPGTSTATTIFSMGNSARNPSGSTGADNSNFPGCIDEVRISSVARGSNEFVFQNISVSASSYQTGTTNYPGNTLDGNLNSRWSAEGDGQWITFDLGRIETVQSVDLAFYNSTGSRTNWFDVLLSNDNTAWRTALARVAATNGTLANFSFTNWPARYVRIVGHTNSVNDFNSLTEVVIHYSVPVDTDSDGLPDIWENFYFSNLNQSPAGDPDGDNQSNAYEFLHGTDPSVQNVSGDSDGDGLPDSWEMAYFGALSYGAGSDPDNDGYGNLQEYLAGSDPTDPNSIPGDINGNNLADSWETNSFGGFVASAYDDPDGDGYNNLAEYVAGTNPTNALAHPSWVSPRAALLRDSVVTTNACLMASSGSYGRAINGISFQDQIVMTFGGYQYTAWYDTVGTTTTTQRVWIARRTVSNASAGAWEPVNTGSVFVNGKGSWDAHCVIALGICPTDGTLHMAWDHHDNTLRYRRSVAGLCTTNKTAWGAAMLNAEQNWLVASGQTELDVTYPQFLATPSGGLVLNRRMGVSGNGDQYFQVYNPSTGAWNAKVQFISRAGTYVGPDPYGTTRTCTERCAYLNGLDMDATGTMHVTWTWRESASQYGNRDICYAYSPDLGVHWYNNAGILIANTSLGQTITQTTSGITIKSLNMRQLLINQQAQCVDSDGRLHVLMLHRRQDPGYGPDVYSAQFSVKFTAYYHYFRDPVTGAWSQRRISPDVFPVGCRPKIAYDAQGNVYAAYLSYPDGTTVVPGYTSGKLIIASASKASQYTDWQIIYSLTNDFNGEPLIDQTRLLVDNILSVFIQENSATTSVVGTPLHVFDFAVNVAPPNALSLNFTGPDSLVVLNATAGHRYQLRYASKLSPPDWSNAGTVLTNSANGLIALPEANGRLNAQRFYRVLTDP